MLSVLISSYRRLEYLQRTLFSLNKFPPKQDWELVVANEISEDDPSIIQELQKYTFKWKIVLCNLNSYLTKFNLNRYGPPMCWTNNVAYKHSVGDVIALLGNDIIITDDAINQLLEDTPKSNEELDYILYSNCYNCPMKFLDEMGKYGENIGNTKQKCANWPLQTYIQTSGVTNYLSISPRSTWEKIKGYDETYINGVAGDDSDFTARVKNAGGKHIYSKVASILHQDHGGISVYRPEHSDSKKREYWNKGLEINRKYLSLLGNQVVNRQKWEWGWSDGFEVISND